MSVPGSSVEVFPDLKSNPYPEALRRRGRKGPPLSGTTFLRLGWRNLSLAQRLGWRLERGDSLARLLYLHRKAVESELDLRHDRATFWWDQLLEQWKRLPAGHPDWVGMMSRIAAENAAGTPSDAEGWRRAVLRGLLLRTHVAFLNGLSEATPPERATERAASHRARIDSLFRDGSLPDAESLALREEVDRLRMTWQASKGRWDRVLRVADGSYAVGNVADPRTARALVLAAAAATRKLGRWTEALRYADRLFVARGARAPGPGGTDIYVCRAGGVIDPPAGLGETEAYRTAMFLRAIDAEGGDDRWASALRHAQEFAQLAPDREDHLERIARVACCGWARAVEQRLWDGALRFAAQAVAAQPGRPESLRRLIRLHKEAALADAPGGESGRSTQKDLREAERIGQQIAALQSLIVAHPEASPAYDTLAHLYLMQAARLSDGGRPARGLLAIARARAYRPDWDQPPKIEPLIEAKLEAQKQTAAALKQKLGPVEVELLRAMGNIGDGPSASGALRSKYSDAVVALDEAATGTSLRDRFQASEEPANIARRRQRARSLWLWKLTGLPADGERADAFVEAYDRFLALGVDGRDEFLEKWDRVRAELPALPLVDVTAVHVARAFLGNAGEPEFVPEKSAAVPGVTDADLDALEDTLRAAFGEPGFPPLDGVPCLPITGPLPAANGPDEPFEFWLFSRREMVSKAAMMLATVLVAGSLLLWARDLSGRWRRDRAFAELGVAVSRLDGEAAGASAHRFRAGLAWPASDPRLRTIEQVERESSAWSTLHARDALYEELGRAVSRSDEVTAARIAEEFLALGPNVWEPRREGVRTLLAELRARAERRRRDEAFARLVGARGRGDDLGVLDAAEQYIEANPVGAADPRTGQVLDWYGDGFRRWFVRDGAGGGPDVMARIDRYRKLAARR